MLRFALRRQAAVQQGKRAQALPQGRLADHKGSLQQAQCDPNCSSVVLFQRGPFCFSKTVLYLVQPDLTGTGYSSGRELEKAQPHFWEETGSNPTCAPSLRLCNHNSSLFTLAVPCMHTEIRSPSLPPSLLVHLRRTQGGTLQGASGEGGPGIWLWNLFHGWGITTLLISHQFCSIHGSRVEDRQPSNQSCCTARASNDAMGYMGRAGADSGVAKVGRGVHCPGYHTLRGANLHPVQWILRHPGGVLGLIEAAHDLPAPQNDSHKGVNTHPQDATKAPGRY